MECSLVAIIITVEPISPEPCPQVHVCLQCIALRDKSINYFTELVNIYIVTVQNVSGCRDDILGRTSWKADSIVADLLSCVEWLSLLWQLSLTIHHFLYMFSSYHQGSVSCFEKEVELTEEDEHDYKLPSCVTVKT